MATHIILGRFSVHGVLHNLLLVPPRPEGGARLGVGGESGNGDAAARKGETRLPPLIDG